MKHRVLIIDPDKPFAEMMCQGLNDASDIEATAVDNGKDAVKAVATTNCNLAIVDMGLEDVKSTLLIRTLRQEHPDLPIVIIPLVGDEIPADLQELSIRGTLTKPFFLPELPDRIRAAIAPQTGEAAPAQAPTDAAPTDVQTPTRTHSAPRGKEVDQYLSQLAQETEAESVILTQDKELITHISRLPEDEVNNLAKLIYESWHTSSRVAQILGKEQLRFEQSIEGGEYLLYSLGITSDIILSVVVEGAVPLGMIRHRTKETAEFVRSTM